MPNMQYDPDTSSKSSRRLPRINLGGFGRTLLIIVLGIIIYLLAAVLTGVISALSTNIDVTAVSIIFDPQITIAYILVYYTTNHFHSFNKKQSYYYLLFTLLLSFTTNFIQGSIVMLALPPLLKKFNFISTDSE